MITSVEEKPTTMSDEKKYYSPDDLLTPQEAVDYLKEKWGLESWSLEAFRQYRHRRGIKSPPAWQPRTLDQLPRPDSSKRRQQVDEEDSEETRN